MATDPPHSEMQALLDRLNGGDVSALGPLFALYQERLRRMVDLRLDHRLKGRVSASDVLQETYIDALKRVRHYLDRPEMPFHVWLRLVAGQRLVEVHRQHLGAKRRDAGQEVSLDGARPGWSAASSVCLAGRLVGDVASPSAAAIRGETLAQLEAALDAMDPIDREVLALRHFEELTNQEVAEVLGLDKSAASKRYVRALTRLKDVLARLPGFAPAG
jgi:RNA polymerase sigma-70 factor (ECF subfamily)